VALVALVVLIILHLVGITLFFKEIEMILFDPDYAAVIGYRPTAWYYAIMVVVSVTIVICFDSVGSIVVVALMVIPAATALFIARSLTQMLIGAFLVATACSLYGYAAAHWWDVSISGSIALMGGVIFMGVGGGQWAVQQVARGWRVQGKQRKEGQRAALLRNIFAILGKNRYH
jgi:manganese/zinc/iron transport system permease protein